MGERRGWRRLADGLVWIGRHELGTLLTFLVAVASLWAFLAIAGEVFEGETRGFDARLLLALRRPGDPAVPVGPAWLQEVARDVTALGGVTWMVGLTLGVVGYLLLDGKRHAAAFLLVAALGGLALSSALKIGYHRPRPDLVPHAVPVGTPSFPSGHALGSTVVYLTLGALLARVQARWRVKAYVLLWAVLLALLVGVSRVYLGVHWPTDVLAGWTGGAAWALACWVAARALQRRGRIEPPRS
jgi:undecaprenyl-diphosphatase